MDRKSRASHYRNLFIGVLLVGSSGWNIIAQQSNPAQQGPPATVRSGFTGTVNNLDASNIRVSRLTYEAGARSYWHVHDGYQMLLVERGRGRMQVQGQRIQELVPGQPAFLPGGVPHWHGAAPDESLTWIAVTVVSNVKWMNPVSDQEYLSDKQR